MPLNDAQTGGSLMPQQHDGSCTILLLEHYTGNLICESSQIRGTLRSYDYDNPERSKSNLERVETLREAPKPFWIW